MSGGDISKLVAAEWIRELQRKPYSWETVAPEEVKEDVAKKEEVVYISGPMRGYEDFNYPAFHKASDYLTKGGYEVLNPAENFNGDTNLPLETYMRADLSMLLEATGIFMIKGWQNSEGARLELAVAKSLGLTVWYEGDDAEPVELEAARIVRNGAREQIYGHPSQDLGRTGNFWGIPPEQVALRMIQMKISRLMSTPTHRDSVVDIIGYAIVYARMVLEKIPDAS